MPKKNKSDRRKMAEYKKTMRRAIKEAGPHGKNVARDAAKETAGYAHGAFIKNDMGLAADYYEMAAWTYELAGPLKYWKEIRKYRS